MKLPWVEQCAGCQYLIAPSDHEQGRCAINARPVIWDADDGWVPGGESWDCDRWDDGQIERRTPDAE